MLQDCNCNKIMVVTFTANCYFYRIFWASLEFWGLVLGLFYEDIGLFFQPGSDNTDCG